MTEEDGIEWKKLFKRKSEPLIVYQVPVGRKYYPEVLELDFKPKNLKHEDWFYYIDEEGLIGESKALQKKIEENPSYLPWLADKIMEDGEELVKEVLSLTESPEQLSDEELKENFKEFNEKFERYMPYIWIIFSIVKMLSKKVKGNLKEIYPDASQEKIEEYFNLLTSVPYEKTPAVEEREELLEIAALLKEEGKITNEVKKRIEKIWEKFTWAGAMRVGWTYLKEPYDLEHYENVVKTLAEENPEKELKEISQEGGGGRRGKEAGIFRQGRN